MFVEVLEDPAVGLAGRGQVVFVEVLDDPVVGLELPVEAVVFVDVLDDPVVVVELAGRGGRVRRPARRSVDAFVLVEVLAVPVPLEDAVVEVEVEAVGELLPVVAEVDGLVTAVVWVVEVEDDAGVGGIEVTGVDVPDVVVVCVPDVVPVEEVPEAVGLFGAVHQVALKVDVVLPLVFDPETETGGVTVVGVEVAEVFEEVCVVDAPPLIVG